MIMGEGRERAGFYLSRKDFSRYFLAGTVAVWAEADVPARLGIGGAEALLAV